MDTQVLSPRQQGLVAISAFTGNGDLERLQSALHAGLDAGLAVNEIKEVLAQLYAYAGFPRSLNAIQTFMAVMEERQAQGLEDVVGQEASPVSPDMEREAYGARVRAKLAGSKEIPPPTGYQLFAPVIDRFLKEHLFADIFVRDNLEHQSRELATVSTLASMTGTASQLRFHLGAAMNTGLTEAQTKDFVATLESRVGAPEAERASDTLSEVLRVRGQ
jgi:4-carboxymuconolactone decarboxylase